MLFREIILKYALKLLIAMAAVLAGLTNLSFVSSLSQRPDLSIREKHRETVRVNPCRVVVKDKEAPPLEPPPVLIPKISENYLKPDTMNIKKVVLSQVIELPDLKSMQQDIKLPVISIKKDFNCPWGQIKSQDTKPSKHCFEMDEVDVLPREILAAQPFYPYRAKRLSICGHVTVRFMVDINGDVSKFIIVESNPYGIFEQSVRDTVPKWKFKPGIKDGMPVRTWLRKTIEFTLDDNA